MTSTDKDYLELPCPSCGGGVPCTREYLLSNSRLCCLNCNKSFSLDGVVDRSQTIQRRQGSTKYTKQYPTDPPQDFPDDDLPF